MCGVYWTKANTSVLSFPRILSSFLCFRPFDGQQWKRRCRSGHQPVTGRTLTFRLSAREIGSNGGTAGIPPARQFSKSDWQTTAWWRLARCCPVASPSMSYSPTEWFPLETAPKTVSDVSFCNRYVARNVQRNLIA